MERLWGCPTTGGVSERCGGRQERKSAPHITMSDDNMCVMIVGAIMVIVVTRTKMVALVLIMTVAMMMMVGKWCW